MEIIYNPQNIAPLCVGKKLTFVYTSGHSLSFRITGVHSAQKEVTNFDTLDENGRSQIVKISKFLTLLNAWKFGHAITEYGTSVELM